MYGSNFPVLISKSTFPHFFLKSKTSASDSEEILSHSQQTAITSCWKKEPRTNWHERRHPALGAGAAQSVYEQERSSHQCLFSLIFLCIFQGLFYILKDKTSQKSLNFPPTSPFISNLYSPLMLTHNSKSQTTRANWTRYCPEQLQNLPWF